MFGYSNFESPDIIKFFQIVAKKIFQHSCDIEQGLKRAKFLQVFHQKNQILLILT